MKYYSGLDKCNNSDFSDAYTNLISELNNEINIERNNSYSNNSNNSNKTNETFDSLDFLDNTNTNTNNLINHNDKKYKNVSLVNNYQFYCINKNLFFQNEYISRNSTYINVRFIKCNPSIHADCGDESEYKKMIKDFYILTVAVDSYLNTNNITNPVNYYIKNISVKLDEGLLHRNYFNIERKQVIINKGFLLKQNTIKNYLSISTVLNDISTSYDGNLYWVTLSSPNLRTKVVRNYASLFDLFFKIGGFANTLFFLFIFISKHTVNYSYKKHMYKYLLKKIYDMGFNIDINAYDYNCEGVESRNILRNVNPTINRNTSILRNSKLNNMGSSNINLLRSHYISSNKLSKNNFSYDSSINYIKPFSNSLIMQDLKVTDNNKEISFKNNSFGPHINNKKINNNNNNSNNNDINCSNIDIPPVESKVFQNNYNSDVKINNFVNNKNNRKFAYNYSINTQSYDNNRKNNNINNDDSIKSNNSNNNISANNIQINHQVNSSFKNFFINDSLISQNNDWRKINKNIYINNSNSNIINNPFQSIVPIVPKMNISSYIKSNDKFEENRFSLSYIDYLKTNLFSLCLKNKTTAHSAYSIYSNTLLNKFLSFETLIDISISNYFNNNSKK